MLITVGVATWLWGRVAQSRLLDAHPAPGRLVDVGGRSMHLYCMGEGTLTVILDAGLMDFSTHWSQVLPEVARIARVCACDHAGLGWSEPSPSPRTSSVMVEELRALTVQADLEAPFVLVGHSFGGLNARLYAQRYPADLAGLVLVDPAHEDQIFRITALRDAAGETLGQFQTLEMLSQFGILALAPDQIPDRGMTPEGLSAYRALLASTGYFREAARELSGLEISLREIRDGGPQDLGALPLIAISRARPDLVPSRPSAPRRPGELTCFWT